MPADALYGSDACFLGPPIDPAAIVPERISSFPCLFLPFFKSIFGLILSLNRFPYHLKQFFSMLYETLTWQTVYFSTIAIRAGTAEKIFRLCAKRVSKKVSLRVVFCFFIGFFIGRSRVFNADFMRDAA
jgi:hypothetical protein